MGRIKLFMIIICFVECCTMSLDEIEDFANFLDSTSQLDQNLKKGTEFSFDYDEDEIISDHAWEDSGKFEGDLILNKRQRRLIIENVAEGLSRNGLRDGTKMWPNAEVIYYIQKEHFTPDQMQAIQNGIDDLARASCVKFRPYQRGDRDAVVIQGSRRGCFSQVGYQGGYQVLNLSGRHPVGRGCFRHGTVVHELLHSLGFFHMQSSPDRDDYVDVLWPNIIQQARHNFRKYNSFAVSDFGVGYDYDSVLHYSRRAFSSNGQDTIVPKKSGVEIGQRVGLSQKDVQKLNKMYCDADSSNSEADEESKQPETKTRSAKNKPFEGHGIGYHQGKAVVIKLLPAAETYKLPDVPSFHLFDYFSKAPQAMSTSEIEGFRVGKEMIQPYHPHLPYSVEEHKKLLKVDTTKSVQNQHSHNILKSENPVEGNVKPLENVDLSKESIQNNTQIVQELLSNENNKQEDEELDENLFEAFERLAKVIEPYSNKYETGKSHGSFYSPEFAQKGKYEQIPKVNNKYDKVLQDTDEDSVDFSNSPYSFDKDESNNDELIKKFNKQSDIKQVDKPEQQEDSSYKIGFPLQAFGYYKQDNLEPTQTPEYQSKEALINRSNYSHLYPKKQNYKRDKVGVMKYTLFGEDVPLYEDKWYKNNEFTFNPAEYERLINIKSQR